MTNLAEHPGRPHVSRETIGPDPDPLIERRNDAIEVSYSVGDRAPEVIRDHAGRPSLIHTGRASKLLEAIGLGMAFSDACEAADLGQSTVLEWVRRGEARDPVRGPDPAYARFAEDYRTARAAGELKLLGDIASAQTASGEPDWRARAWILERTRPDRYGKRLQVDANISAERDELLARMGAFIELPVADDPAPEIPSEGPHDAQEALGELGPGETP